VTGDNGLVNEECIPEFVARRFKLAIADGPCDALRQLIFDNADVRAYDMHVLQCVCSTISCLDHCNAVLLSSQIRNDGFSAW